LLKQTNVFITGAESGIGKEVTLRLLSEGYSVFACHHLPIEGVESYESRANPKAKLVTHQLDVTDNLKISDAVKIAQEQFGSIDVLINVAGIAYFGDPVSTTDSEWQQTFDVNVNGYFYLTRALLPILTRNPGSMILNMSSVWGIRGNANMYAYSVSKHAVEGLTKGLQEYCKPYKVKVTSLVLDKVDTNFRDLMGSKVNVSDAQKKTMLRPTDIADAVLYILTTSSTSLVSSITLDSYLWE